MSLLYTTVTVLSSRLVRSQITKQSCSPELILPSFTVLWTMPWNWEQWRWVCVRVLWSPSSTATSLLYPSAQTNKFLPLRPLNFSSLFPSLSLRLSLSSNAPLSILHHFFPPSLPPPSSSPPPPPPPSPFLCCPSLHSSLSLSSLSLSPTARRCSLHHAASGCTNFRRRKETKD